MSRRRRGLSPEERNLWQKIASTARAMRPARPVRPDDGDDHTPPPKPQPTLLEAFRIGDAARPMPRPHDLAPAPHDGLKGQPVRMDRRAYDKMLRGRLAPEARLDLHGMTLSEAHPELIRFVLNAHADGLRLVLVITGKGKRGEDHGPIPQRMGALRHQVPHWLALPPLGSAVLQVAPASLRHGGTGAYYVYLRRGR